MKVFALFNVKGGVGKTAGAVNLAWLSAREGARTLLVDLDPQGAATFTFRIEPRIEGGVERLLRDPEVLPAAIRGSDAERLDVLPSDPSFHDLGTELAQEPERLRDLLAPLEREYERVFLDCAPGLSPVAEAVFAAADALLVPTIPTTLSLRTLAQLMKHLKRHPKPPPALPYFGMVDRRRALHRSVQEWVEAQGLEFLRTRVPYSAVVEQMSLQRGSLFVHAPASAAALAYVELWREIQERLGVGAERSLSCSRDARQSIERWIQPVRPPPERTQSPEAARSELERGLA